MAKFYKVIIQTVLLYSCESWVFTDRMLRQLERFHHRICRSIAGVHPRQLPDGRWQYPDMFMVRQQIRVGPISWYIAKRRKGYFYLRWRHPLYYIGQDLPTTSATGNATFLWHDDVDELWEHYGPDPEGELAVQEAIAAAQAARAAEIVAATANLHA